MIPSKTYTNEEIASYLLDAISEAEANSLERAYFEDPILAATVSEIENNLIDDYVRGQLPRQEQELFEKNYLSHPNRRRRIENARFLITNLDLLKKQPLAIEKASWWRSLFDFMRGGNLSLAYQALGLLLIVSGCFYLWRLNNQQHRQAAIPQIAQSGNQQGNRSLQSSPTPQGKEQPAKEIAQLRPRPSAPSLRSKNISEIPTLMLTTGVARRRREGVESPSQSQVITSKDKEIRLVLKTQATDYPSYTAQIQTDEEPGLNLYTFPNKIKPSRHGDIETLVIVIPTATFKKGAFNYRLVLTGIMASGGEQVGPISFRVEKR